MTAARTARHLKLSAFLASRSDVQLAELVGTGQAVSVGVGGGSEVIDVDGVPVFTKRIPLTDREVANSRSTANLSICRCSASTVSADQGSTPGESWPRTS